MPTIPSPTTNTPQQDGTSSIDGLGRANQVQTLELSSTPPIQTPNHSNIPSSLTPTRSNQIGDGSSTQSSTIGEGESNNRGQRRIFVTFTSTGLESSSKCSDFIFESFKNELDPNGINWKGVSQPVRDFYFGEFKAIEKGRDPTPSELLLHIHTHGHDGKSFVDERAQIVHINVKHIHQATGGEKKRRIYGLGSQAKSYYKQNLSMTSFSDASSSVPLFVSQSTPMKNLKEFVK